jgi:hypothetical protein
VETPQEPDNQADREPTELSDEDRILAMNLEAAKQRVKGKIEALGHTPEDRGRELVGQLKAETNRLITAKAELSKEMAQAAAEGIILKERLAFIRAVTAIILFVAVWQTSIALGAHCWLGGALMASLMTLFPSVFDQQTYAWTRSLGFVKGKIAVYTVTLVFAIIADVLVVPLGIPQ